MPLGGLPKSVVEDVAPGRHGRRGASRIREGRSQVARLGHRVPRIEWLNADSEWRDRPGRLWDAVATPVGAGSHHPRRFSIVGGFELRAWDRRGGAAPGRGPRRA
jgi:hypothetical protein